MQQKARTIIVSLALAALPAVAFAQSGPGGPGGGQRGARNPVATLLERRDTLRLTAEQITRLEAWRQRWDTETAPMRAQMDSMRAQGGGGGGSGGPPDQATMDRVRPVMQQMRAISAALRDSAYVVLTPEQQALARSLEPPMGPGRRP